MFEQLERMQMIDKQEPEKNKKKESKKMVENEITISIQRYNELIRKEAVFEIKKRETLMSSYVSENDKVLYEAMDSLHRASEEVE